MTETALLQQQIAAKKTELDQLRPQAPHGLENLNHSYDLELTYTSNAIEGNTLSAAETRMVIEQGITIGGKPLKDHLEAIDHFEALRYVRDLARQAVPLREADIRNLHQPGRDLGMAFTEHPGETPAVTLVRSASSSLPVRVSPASILSCLVPASSA
jgi:Fic family protein